MRDLIQLIDQLSREEALEAANFLGDVITLEVGTGDVEAGALKPLTDQPYQSIEAIEQLARLLLITAATIPEYEDDVRKAIEGAGRKQFILSGTEIVALSIVALGALHVLISKGKTGVKRGIKISGEGDRATVEIQEEVHYGISSQLATILRSYLKI